MASVPVAIRRADESDVEQIATVLLRAFEEFRPLYTPAGFAATTPGADVLRSRLNEGPTWVAVHDGSIVGTVSAVTTEAGLYVRSMAVLPTMRGHKLAARLLDEIESFARRQGIEHLVLSTTPFLRSAIQLYEKSGFMRIDNEVDDLFGTPLFTMAKILA